MPAQLLDAPGPRDLLEVVRRLTLLQIDPTAAIAPSADLVAGSRLGSAYDSAQVKQALEQDRSLFELDAYIRPMSDLPCTSPARPTGPRGTERASRDGCLGGHPRHLRGRRWGYFTMRSSTTTG